GDLVAWLGPAAGPQAYEIGSEVFDAFVSRDARTEPAFTATRPGHWRVDLYALARRRLADAGVAAVHGGGLCTISDAKRFFSHRRDGRSGRIATLAWIATGKLGHDLVLPACRCDPGVVRLRTGNGAGGRG